MSPSRGRRRRLSAFLRSSLGLILLPTSVAVLLVSAKVLGGLSGAGPSSLHFFCGVGGYAALYLLGIARLRRLYVLAHESTHALAAWASGARVLRFVVRARSGHVDLSRSNVFISLAPYWIPFYSLLVVLSYRVVLWVRPFPHAREVFLALMGASLSFHLLHTAESLWSTHQGDLDEAGLLLSMALIALLNGGALLLAMKCLFPGLVALDAELAQAAAATVLFWRGAWSCVLWAASKTGLS